MEIKSYNLTLTQEEVDYLYLISGFVKYNKTTPNASKACLSIGETLERLVSNKNFEGYSKVGCDQEIENNIVVGFAMKFLEDV